MAHFKILVGGAHSYPMVIRILYYTGQILYYHKKYAMFTVNSLSEPISIIDPYKKAFDSDIMYGTSICVSL